MAKRDDEEARWYANEAEKNDIDNKFDRLVKNSYENKDEAWGNINKFGDKYGKEELSHALRTEPHSFGALPKDPGKAAEAQQRYRPELAPTFRDYGKAHDHGKGLEGSLADKPGGFSAPGGDTRKESGLWALWNRPQSPSSPPGGSGGMPHGSQQAQPVQGAPTQLSPSSYPLESPFRAQSQLRPQSGQTPSPAHSSALTPPQGRHPLSLGSPALAKAVPEPNKPAAPSSPQPDRHRLSLNSPALPKIASAQAALSPASQQPTRDFLKTPVSQTPQYRKHKGLDDGK